MAPLVHVVGIGADGWEGLAPGPQALVLHADVLLGGARHLALVPDVAGQRREAWPSPLREGLPALLASTEGRAVVALASGDPFVSGIGATLVDLLGTAGVVVHPHVSSAALAGARMGWPSETYDVVTLVGRDPSVLSRWVAPGRRLLLLSSDGSTPAVVADLLTRLGYGASAMTVLGDLAGPAESRTDHARADALDGDSPPLNVVALTCAVDDPAVVHASLPGLPDDAFEHDGQLTKRDVRASALARLAPTPGELLWDVGAGAGSLGIEWMRAHPRNRAVAVEGDPVRAERIARNASALGVPALQVVTGRAPDALAGLPAPDAVFVGGGATVDGLLEACVAALRPGGRLVAHGVTLETEARLHRAYVEHGGELTRLSVEHADAIGGFTGWAPARAVVQWSMRA
ncbi:precorrin-6y C5,15-methyltransferase (decarboxylating) subunit CbiE [Solicola sp. PLA-1-18]|uniref:precorrin-6y C5,15-methyltransferase (decarboxylating) subunit CbiE n=1 Tax=Solicola sp. PLA-1-18 TaxID=3380532 RepID=UPI003B7B4766